MNKDSNDCPKNSEGLNWEILLLAGWMQGAVNMRYMPCKIPELGRSFPCLSRCILTRSWLTSGMSWRRSSFSTWSVGSLQSSPPTFLVRSQIHKTPKFSFPLTDQESSNRNLGIWFSPRNMQNQPQLAANNYTASRCQHEDVYHVKSSPNLAGSETKREGLEMCTLWKMA